MSNKLETHERFKYARTVYNKNGKQTMSEVESATGIQKSMISSLEKDDTRGASFRDIAKLAKHYGVSMDWLCGLTEIKSPETEIRGIIQSTGLDDSAIKQLIRMKKCSDSTASFPSDVGHNALSFYSHLISNVDVLEEISFDIDRLASIQNRGLTESEKVVFKNSDEAISFYRYKIQKTLDSFVNGWLELYKEKNGSMDKEGSGKEHGG